MLAGKRNGVETVKLQVTVDTNTARIIDEMVLLGIHGANKAEVAAWVISNWMWAQQDGLEKNGIRIYSGKVKE